MQYTIYKTTNLVNGKIYIGVHKTNNLDDGYMGSGLLLKRAIEKYGIENFKKEILAIFDNAKDMFDMESEIVNEEFIDDENTYNINEGGYGGWSHNNKNGIAKNWNETVNHTGIRKEINKKLWQDNEFRVRHKNRMIYLHKNHPEKFNHDGFKGKHHTEEVKKSIGKKNSIHQKGSGNSQYGTCWIYNEEEKVSKRVSKEEANDFIEQGWLRGRKIKF